LIALKDGEQGSKEMSRSIGGCAMNTSRAANYYLQARLGEEASDKIKTLGSIGDDEAGKWILQKLKEEKLNADLMVIENSITGSCPVTVVEGDRTCVAILDACENYKATHIEKVLAEEKDLTKVKYMYTTGFMLEINKEACQIMYKNVESFSLCYNLASEHC